MSSLIKKAPLDGTWWRKLVHTLRWNKNAGLPLSEKYWQDFNDKIMSQIDNKKSQEVFIDKKKGLDQLSAEI